jgi:quercetin dioxygenase-like cupin family protein
MHQKRFFKDVPKEKIKEAMEKEGYAPAVIFDEPGFVYEPHQHNETNFLVCLEGGMKLTVGEEKVNFQPGDKLIIPHHTIHFGKVGPKGCTYFWAAKA